MSEEKARLVINPPTDDSPGFLWRMRKSLEFRSKLEGADITAEKMMSLFELAVDELFLPYVVEPADPREAKDLILGPNGLSKNEFYQVLGIEDIASENEVKNGKSAPLPKQTSRRKKS